QCNLRIRWNRRMTAHKHQSQTVVTNFLFRKNRLIHRASLAIHRMNNFRLLDMEHLSTSDDIQRQVSRCAHDPGGRILRNSIKRPGLQRARQRFLDHVFCEGEMLDSEDLCQSRDHLSSLTTKKMFHQLGHLLWILNRSFQRHRFCHTLKTRKDNRVSFWQDPCEHEPFPRRCRATPRLFRAVLLPGCRRRTSDAPPGWAGRIAGCNPPCNPGVPKAVHSNADRSPYCPRDNLGPWAFLSVFADPSLDLVVCCAGGDARPELVVINLRKFQPSLIERAVGMVFAFPAN